MAVLDYHFKWQLPTYNLTQHVGQLFWNQQLYNRDPNLDDLPSAQMKQNESSKYRGQEILCPSDQKVKFKFWRETRTFVNIQNTSYKIRTSRSILIRCAISMRNYFFFPNPILRTVPIYWKRQFFCDTFACRSAVSNRMEAWFSEPLRFFLSACVKRLTSKF